MEYTEVLVLLAVLAALAAGHISAYFMNRRYEMSEKVDKGFALCYWKLSYRRKFIRTLWMTVVFIVLLIPGAASYRLSPFICAVGAVAAVGTLIQIVWTYRKWKEEERDEAEKTEGI